MCNRHIGGYPIILFFHRDYPDYDAYTVLDVFQIDWLNEVWDQRTPGGSQDDYRFVYMGPKGTWYVPPTHTSEQ